MFALVDCNSFYASCERVFRPDLRTKPVVVLSNNDGCVVALTKEAKNLGVKMCDPWFKIEREFKQKGGIAFSSNYELYGDISSRIMSILEELAPKVEVYSIDEAFLDLTGISHCMNLEEFGRTCQKQIMQYTGMPVRVGIGPTKTLAKAASYGAKRYPTTQGVLDITDLYRREKLMTLMPVNEIWGVGRRLNKRLISQKVLTTFDLINMNIEQVRKQFSIMLVNTIRELKGESCIPLDSAPSPKKQIVVSRTFSTRVTELDYLEEAVSDYAARAAEKLRKEGKTCKMLSVFIRTNPFRKQDIQHREIRSFSMLYPTNDTRDLIKHAKLLLKDLYKEGFNYNKAGIMLNNFFDETTYQLDLFKKKDRNSKDFKMMALLDQVNKSSLGQISFLAQGIKKEWSMKRQLQSPRYTTSLKDVLVVN
ncbi:MAG: translesion error-prone DNA polymerase V subunit UmuC [Gammaproteobacteria bacterium]|nr:MAG: translesion error-prone DNA polymerase V subunit UmuC [Gammaproteobacteria bacterium]|tara:strand:+ start:1389 stop:2651 length:1263 start_codon:yes stop_codon:yes gene_type:complete